MKAIGFRFEPFGDGAVRISAAPETVTDPEAALLAALDALAGGEDLAKALACKGSTKFGESLSREEMKLLLREWRCLRVRRGLPPRAADREAPAAGGSAQGVREALASRSTGTGRSYERPVPDSSWPAGRLREV